MKDVKTHPVLAVGKYSGKHTVVKAKLMEGKNRTWLEVSARQYKAAENKTDYSGGAITLDAPSGFEPFQQYPDGSWVAFRSF